MKTVAQADAQVVDAKAVSWSGVARYGHGGTRRHSRILAIGKRAFAWQADGDCGRRPPESVGGIS